MLGQRVHERFPHRLPVEIVHDGQSYEGITHNISMGGMFIFTSLQVPFGTEFTLKTRLPETEEDLLVPVQVRWQRSDGMGVQYLSMAPGEEFALDRLLKSLRPPA